MKRGRADRTLIAAGLATIALGALLLLDRTRVIDVHFDYMLPAVLAAFGAVLLVAGLSRMTDEEFRPPVTETAPATPARRYEPMRRDPANGYIAGVCAGFAARLGIDPLLIRIGFVLTLAAGGVGHPALRHRLGADPGRGPGAARGRRACSTAATPGWSRPGWAA